MSARRAADSAPSGGRNFDGEFEALKKKSDALRTQIDAATNDLEQSAQKALLRVNAAADNAMQLGERAAEGARAKIHEQQERFKAGVIADGLSLDDEYEGATIDRRALGAEATAAGGGTNKYALIMNRKKQEQAAR